MRFYKHLYVSESMEKKKGKIIRRLKAGKFSLSCYVIALTENPANQLEFYDAAFLLQKNYKKDTLFVVGLAGCYEEALELVRQISEDTYKKRNDVNIRKFVMEEQGSQS